MFEFDGLSDVEETLQDLSEREPSLVGLMEPIPEEKKEDGSIKFPAPKIEDFDSGNQSLFRRRIVDWNKWAI